MTTSRSMGMRLTRCTFFCIVGFSIARDATAQQAAAPAENSVETFVLPRRDSTLQPALDSVLRQPPFARLIRERRLSVSLVDLSDPEMPRYAARLDDEMRYAASLPKIAILLSVFDAIDRGDVTYTPALRRKMERMIRRSSNSASTELIQLVGFEAIERTLRDPRYELYDRDRQGGLWVGRDYGGGVGLWRRDPMHQISHGATTRQVARFFVMLDQGMLVSPWASAEMKSILAKPEINHKFVLGLKARPGSTIYRKSGTWRNFHADAALVERDGKKYVAVAIMESNTRGVLSRLIVQLDNLIYRPRAVAQKAAQP